MNKDIDKFVENVKFLKTLNRERRRDIAKSSGVSSNELKQFIEEASVAIDKYEEALSLVNKYKDSTELASQHQHTINTLLSQLGSFREMLIKIKLPK